MQVRRFILVIIGCFFLPNVFAGENAETATVVSIEDVRWGFLNPLRGDKSPGAAELWGNRTTNSPTGMLVKFNSGFSSPPHIHNITYRGVVILGSVHNDDPTAEKLWMPTGSFWTQPAGANHITAASGESNLIFLEIESGPYLVKPSSTKFDNGERPINIHASNLVWISGDRLDFIESSKVEIATLWGSTKQNEVGGALLKLPAGFNGKIDVEAGEFRAVVIQGNLTYTPDSKKRKTLSPGSYIGSTDKIGLSLSASQEVWVYVRSNNTFMIGSD